MLNAKDNFPLWLAPDQLRVITLNDDEALINYAKPIVAELRANRVRVDAPPLTVGGGPHGGPVR